MLYSSALTTKVPMVHIVMHVVEAHKQSVIRIFYCVGGVALTDEAGALRRYTRTAWTEEGLKAINPKVTITKAEAMPRGDQYCEFIYVFKG